MTDIKTDIDLPPFRPKTVAAIEECLYWYKAVVMAHPKRKGESAYDGDTLWLELQPGFDRGWREDTRVARIDAPEVNRRASVVLGKVSRDWLRAKLPIGTKIFVRTFKEAGKYGRYVADLYLPKEDGTVECINDLLVEEGHAVYKEY
jgi:endonuclease YncB( thermonuclease family)